MDAYVFQLREPPEVFEDETVSGRRERDEVPSGVEEVEASVVAPGREVSDADEHLESTVGDEEQGGTDEEELDTDVVGAPSDPETPDCPPYRVDVEVQQLQWEVEEELGVAE